MRTRQPPFASASVFRVRSAAGLDWSVDGEYAAGEAETVIRCIKDAVCIAVPGDFSDKS